MKVQDSFLTQSSEPGSLHSAGKTHTMQGPAADPGVNQRALQELFAATSGNADISVAMLEIYNEDVRDLLAADSAKVLDVCALGPGQLPPGD